MPPQDVQGESSRERTSDIGLCSSCRHSRRVPAPRATYWLCELSATDSRFEKYPRLPVLDCPGYERREASS